MSGGLAVVVKGYPRLSETFIAQELLALEARGFRFDIWSLRAPYDDREHPMHGQIRAGRRYLPEYTHAAAGRLRAARPVAMAMPGWARARALWRADLARDPTANRVRRWGQAIILAAELPAGIRFLYAHFLHTPASVARYAAAIRGHGWGVSAHAKDIWTIPDWEKREKLGDAAFAVTCTASGAAHLRMLAPDPSRVDLAWHGLDLTRFPAPPVRIPRADGVLRILSVGRLVEKKGYADLLDALALLPPGLAWHFTQIGGGDLKDRLRAQAAALGLADRITWIGRRDQSDIVAAMREADLFVLPSRIAADGDRDGLPNVLMEAASQLLPILSTAVSAIPDFIRPGREGVLVQPGDPDLLAAAIMAHAGAPERGAEMARAARARLIAQFGMEEGIGRIAGRLTAALAGP